MQRKDRIDAFGATLLVSFSMLLGLNQVFVKIVNSGFQPVFQAGLRSACAILPVLAYALIARKRLSISDGSLIPGIACGLLFGFEFLLLFQALDFTSVARASVLFYTMPFWLAIGAHFLIPGERLTVQKLSGMGLAIIGVAWAMVDRDNTAGELALIGDIACLVASVFWAGIALLARATPLSRSSPEMTLLYQLFVSAIVLLALTPLITEPIRTVTPIVLGMFAFQVFVVVGFSFLGWFWVLSIYPASEMASFGFLAPVFGVFFGWLVLDEAISPTIIGALVLVSAGIVLINRKPKSKKQVSSRGVDQPRDTEYQTIRR